MNKKILCVILLTILATGLNGCGNENSLSTSESPNIQSVVSSEPSYQENSYMQTSKPFSKTDSTAQISTSELSTAKDKYNEVINIISNATLQYPSSNDKFEYNVYDTYVQITKYKGRDTDVIFPSTIDNLPVLVVGDYYNFVTVIQEYNVNLLEKDERNIGRYDKLVSLTFSEGIAIIGKGAFDNGIGKVANEPVETIKLPTSLVAIGKEAFEGMNSLTSLNLPEGIYTIGEYAFSSAFKPYQENSLEITLPKSLDALGKSAFSANLTEISKVTVLNPKTIIGDHSLDNNSQLFGKFEIYGYIGSTAAQYAAENTNNCVFKPID